MDTERGLETWAESVEVEVRIDGDEIWEPVRARPLGPGVFLLEEAAWWTSNPSGAVVAARRDRSGRLCIDRCLEASTNQLSRHFVRERELGLLRELLSELEVRGGDWRHLLGGTLVVHGDPSALAWFAAAVAPVIDRVRQRPPRTPVPLAVAPDPPAARPRPVTVPA